MSSRQGSFPVCAMGFNSFAHHSIPCLHQCVRYVAYSMETVRRYDDEERASYAPGSAQRRGPYLHQVGGKAGPSVGVEVCKGGCHSWNCNSILNGQADHLPPALLSLDKHISKEGVYYQILEINVALVGGLDVVQESSSDDAPTLQARRSRLAVLKGDSFSRERQ